MGIEVRVSKYGVSRISRLSDALIDDPPALSAFFKSLAKLLDEQLERDEARFTANPVLDDPLAGGDAFPVSPDPASDAVFDLMGALNIERTKGTEDTPDRVAEMWAELLVGQFDDPAKYLRSWFEEDHHELVIVSHAPFQAVCEHHLLPFVGYADIGYIPDGKVVGLSKLVRCLRAATRRATMQERATTLVADSIMTALQPMGCMVILRAEHLCMTIRGVQVPGTITTTSAVRGVFENDQPLRTEFLALTKAPA